MFFFLGRVSNAGIFWSNYSNLTGVFTPEWLFSKGNPFISGKSRLVKCFNSARISTRWSPKKLAGFPVWCCFFSHGHPCLRKITSLTNMFFQLYSICWSCVWVTYTRILEKNQRRFQPKAFETVFVSGKTRPPKYIYLYKYMEGKVVFGEVLLLWPPSVIPRSWGQI